MRWFIAKIVITQSGDRRSGNGLFHIIDLLYLTMPLHRVLDSNHHILKKEQSKFGYMAHMNVKMIKIGRNACACVLEVFKLIWPNLAIVSIVIA